MITSLAAERSEHAISQPGAPLDLEIFHVIGEAVIAVGHLLKGISGDLVHQRIRGAAQLISFEPQAFDLAQYVTHVSPAQLRG